MKRGRYYTPPTSIVPVQGVTISSHEDVDEYAGTKAALVAAGLLASDQFPGEPGLPAGTVRYRPHGASRENGWLHTQPGYMTVYRRLDGTFRIVLTVSADEKRRRERNRVATEGSERARRWIIRLGNETPDYVPRRIFDVPAADRARVAKDLRSPANRVNQAVTRAMLVTLDALEEADLERTLDEPAFAAAEAVIERVARQGAL
jgi:hypothetical protein